MTLPIEQIRQAYQQGKIGGSWLITGGSDIEKKHFILECCSLLLKQNINDITAFHPDIKWLEFGLTDEAKKDIQKSILAGKAVDLNMDYARKREITVDDIREGIQFLSLKGAPDQFKILIISPADRMNENASNALLKELEEPAENSVIFLLCQNLGRFPATIKSRCRQIKLPPLPDTELKEKIQKDYPDVSDIDLIISLSNHSLGFAQDMCRYNGVKLYHQMLQLCQPDLPVADMKSFVDTVTADPKIFSMVQTLILNWVAGQARRQAITAPILAEDFVDLYNEIIVLFEDIDRIYLDKKNALQTIFFRISEVLR